MCHVSAIPALEVDTGGSQDQVQPGHLSKMLSEKAPRSGSVVEHLTGIFKTLGSFLSSTILLLPRAGRGGMGDMRFHTASKGKQSSWSVAEVKRIFSHEIGSRA